MTRCERPGAVAFRLAYFSIWAMSAVIIVAGTALRPSQLPGTSNDSCLSWASRGLGTHTQINELIGASVCGECDFWKRYGVPCPTCGMTTAVSLLLHGRPLRALACQPFGCTVGIAAVVLVVWSSIGVVAGHCPQPIFHARMIEKGLVVMAVFFAVSWLYKIIATAFG